MAEIALKGHCDVVSRQTGFYQEKAQIHHRYVFFYPDVTSSDQGLRRDQKSGGQTLMPKIATAKDHELPFKGIICKKVEEGVQW